MNIDRLTYRIYRLRRLFLLSAVPPVLALWLMQSAGTPVTSVIYALGVLMPWAHILRYPNVWYETLSVSLVAAAVVCLAATVPAGTGAAAWLGYGLALLVLAFLVFICLVPVVALASLRGAERAVAFRTRRWSRLPAEALREKITAYPGRCDDTVECGPADKDGMFRMTQRNKLAAFEAPPDAEAPAGVLQPKPDENGKVLVELDSFAKLGRSDAVCHEVFVSHDEGRNVSVSRHEFTRVKGGTLVEYAERATGLPTGNAIGLWLTDHIADFLTSEIDRAEGRATRSHRLAGHHQLIIDIARPLSRFCAAPPEDASKMRGPWVR